MATFTTTTTTKALLEEHGLLLRRSRDDYDHSVERLPELMMESMRGKVTVQGVWLKGLPGTHPRRLGEEGDKAAAAGGDGKKGDGGEKSISLWWR